MLPLFIICFLILQYSELIIQHIFGIHSFRPVFQQHLSIYGKIATLVVDERSTTFIPPNPYVNVHMLWKTSLKPLFCSLHAYFPFTFRHETLISRPSSCVVQCFAKNPRTLDQPMFFVCVCVYCLLNMSCTLDRIIAAILHI